MGEDAKRMYAAHSDPAAFEAAQKPDYEKKFDIFMNGVKHDW